MWLGLEAAKKYWVILPVATALPLPLAFADGAGTREEQSSLASRGVASTSTPTRKGADPRAEPVSAQQPDAPPADEIDGDAEDEIEPLPVAPTPAPSSKPSGVVRQPAVVKEGMVRIPGGRFTMGSDEKKAPPNERPARTVVLAPFWIDRTEVTVGAYRACVDKGACPRPARSSASCTYDIGDPNLPVSCVPWTSAQTYCLAVGRRLPREVEWEMAARGPTPIKYPWGGNSAAGCSTAVTLIGDTTQRSCSGKKPARVASRPSGMSPYGVYDMSGNVEEWVADWYGETVSDLSPRAGASHVLRGGGWLTPPALAKTTSRNWGSAREMGPNVGFRCAKDD